MMIQARAKSCEKWCWQYFPLRRLDAGCEAAQLSGSEYPMNVSPPARDVYDF